MNKGFLQLIDLSTNIQRALQSIRGISGGVAAVMAVGLAVLACGLAPLVWYFDLDATLSYADPLIQQLLPTLPSQAVAWSSFVVLGVTCLPTIVELLMPRIGSNVQAAAFLVFGFSAVDAVTDWPRVHMVMQAYQGYFSQWGILGYGLWYVCHIPLLLFATFLFELLFVLCIVLIAVLLLKVAGNEHTLKQQVKEAKA